MGVVMDTATTNWEQQLSQLSIPEELSLESYSLDYFKARFTETSSFKDNAALLERQTGLFDFGNYEQKLVFVEWKTCDNVRLSHKGDAFMQAFSLAHRLAVRGPPENLLPSCIGFVGNACEGESRFGYIFEMPEGSNEQTSLKTLQSILGDSEHKPTPFQRASLARQIAAALLHLHEVGWLHRSIHSGNILFCVNKDKLDLGKPTLSGFEYPRPQSDTARPGGLDRRWIVYAPPRLQGGVPRAGSWQILDDIYGLGLLILEIGHWQALHTLLCLKRLPAPPQQALRVRAWLTGEEDSQLPSKQNPLLKLRDFLPDNETEEFLAAASRCVHAYGEKGLLVEENVDQSDKSVKAYVLKMFFELVIEKLNSFQGFDAPETAGWVVV